MKTLSSGCALQDSDPGEATDLVEVTIGRLLPMLCELGSSHTPWTRLGSLLGQDLGVQHPFPTVTSKVGGKKSTSAESQSALCRSKTAPLSLGVAVDSPRLLDTGC